MSATTDQNQGGYPQGGNPQRGYPQAGDPAPGFPQRIEGGGYPPPHQPGPYGGAGYGQVYAILLCQLLVTGAFISLFLFHRGIKTWARGSSYMEFVALSVVFVCLIVMACCTNVWRQALMNFIFLGIFTLAESVLLGFVASVYNVDDVLLAAVITAAVCLALTWFAFQTKFDFTTMGGILLCASVVLILFGTVAIFIPRNNIVTLVYASLGALIFSVFLVYDTQLMMAGKHKYSVSPEEYIFAALHVYLDIINIFLYILTIIGVARD